MPMQETLRDHVQAEAGKEASVAPVQEARAEAIHTEPCLNKKFPGDL